MFGLRRLSAAGAWGRRPGRAGTRGWAASLRARRGGAGSPRARLGAPRSAVHSHRSPGRGRRQSLASTARTGSETPRAGPLPPPLRRPRPAAGCGRRGRSRGPAAATAPGDCGRGAAAPPRGAAGTAVGAPAPRRGRAGCGGTPGAGLRREAGRGARPGPLLAAPRGALCRLPAGARRATTGGTSCVRREGRAGRRPPRGVEEGERRARRKAPSGAAASPAGGGGGTSGRGAAKSGPGRQRRAEGVRGKAAVGAVRAERVRRRSHVRAGRCAAGTRPQKANRNHQPSAAKENKPGSVLSLLACHWRASAAAPL